MGKTSIYIIYKELKKKNVHAMHMGYRKPFECICEIWYGRRKKKEHKGYKLYIYDFIYNASFKPFNNLLTGGG